MTELKKDIQETDKVLEKKELSYREQKAKERKQNKFLKALFKSQDKLEAGNPNELTFQSKILVALGSMFQDSTKFKWKNTSKEYKPFVTNEELYSEVHDREIGSKQYQRLQAKALSPQTPQFPKANLQISFVRHDLFTFNGNTSALIAFIVLFVASLLSTGIATTKAGYEKVAVAYKQKKEEEKSNPKASDYFESLKDYTNEQLSIEKSSAVPRTVKRAITDYYLLKNFKRETEIKYQGTTAPEDVSKKYEEAVKEINRLALVVKAHAGETINTTIEEK